MPLRILAPLQERFSDLKLQLSETDVYLRDEDVAAAEVCRALHWHTAASMSCSPANKDLAEQHL